MVPMPLEKPISALSHLSYIFPTLPVNSPWYNRTSWLSLKHQLTYLPVKWFQCSPDWDGPLSPFQGRPLSAFPFSSRWYSFNMIHSHSIQHIMGNRAPTRGCMLTLSLLASYCLYPGCQGSSRMPAVLSVLHQDWGCSHCHDYVRLLLVLAQQTFCFKMPVLQQNVHCAKSLTSGLYSLLQ